MTVRTSSSELQRLQVSGRTVVESRAQIAAILSNRLGKQAAKLFAVPSVTDDGGYVTWVDADGETLTPISALPTDQEDSIRARNDELRQSIWEFADTVRGEGDAGQLVAQILQYALVTPDGQEPLHAAGGQPVLVNWGYAAEGQVLPGAAIEAPLPASEPATASAAAVFTAAAASGDHASEIPAAATSAAVTRRDGVFWLAWLAPFALLLALGWMIWLLLQPLEPVIVETELPRDPVEEPVRDAQARLDALREQLLEAQQLHDSLKGVCVAIPEPEPEPERERERTVIVPPVEPEEPPQVIRPEPEPEPRPAPRAVVPRTEPLELPPEVPRAEDLPVELAERPSTPRKQPTLCEPRWTPTQRPEVMVVIDGSGSMSESFPGSSSRIGAAKQSVERVVRSLHEDIRTGLVTFTDCGATTRPKKYTYSERPELLSRVRDVSPTRGTSLANSIRRAGNAAKSGGPATVVVVSDGADTCGGDPCAVARKLKAQKPLLKVNVIDLSGGRSSVLQCVASVTGGRVFSPRNADQMNQEMQKATGQPDASQCKP